MFTLSNFKEKCFSSHNIIHISEFSQRSSYKILTNWEISLCSVTGIGLRFPDVVRLMYIRMSWIIQRTSFYGWRYLVNSNNSHSQSLPDCLFTIVHSQLWPSIQNLYDNAKPVGFLGSPVQPLAGSVVHCSKRLDCPLEL